MAIISLSGRQYLVSEKEKFETFKLDKKEGDVFDVKDELSGKTVKLKVIMHKKAPKIRVLKFKKKTGYKKVYGNRANLTQLEVV